MTQTISKYWYAREIWYCPVCGSEYGGEKFRVYKEEQKGTHITEKYDYCD